MKDDKKGPRKKITLIVIIAVGAVFLIAGGGGTYYAGTNDFCATRCHQMKTRAANWKKSTHKDIKCITCHSEPGIVGEFKAHIDGINYLKSFLKEKNTHITIFAKRRNPARLKSCINCHPADTLKDETETLKINHLVHIKDDKFLCTDCHANMIHGWKSFEKSRPTEARCIACHMRESARLNCQSCHKQKMEGNQKRARHPFVLEYMKEGWQQPRT